MELLCNMLHILEEISVALRSTCMKIEFYKWHMHSLVFTENIQQKHTVPKILETNQFSNNFNLYGLHTKFQHCFVSEVVCMCVWVYMRAELFFFTLSILWALCIHNKQQVQIFHLISFQIERKWRERKKISLPFILTLLHVHDVSNKETFILK